MLVFFVCLLFISIIPLEYKEENYLETVFIITQFQWIIKYIQDFKGNKTIYLIRLKLYLIVLGIKEWDNHYEKKEKPSMRHSMVHILNLFKGPCQAIYMFMLILYKQEGRLLDTTENVTASQL